MMPGKVIWKHGIGEIAKASREIAPVPHKGRRGGVGYIASYEPPVAMANVLSY